MKRNIALVIVVLFIILVIGTSCGSFPPELSSSRTWSIPDKEKINGTVWIARVSADKSGIRASLEKETSSLLPLIFMDEGYLCLPEQDDADFTVEAIVREKEYMRGWKTKTSVSVEVKFWQKSVSRDQSAMPVAACCVTAQGNVTLSSSKTLNHMLKKAVKGAIKGLERI